MVPDGWRSLTFGEVTDNFDRLREPVKEASRRPGPFPFFGASGVVDHVDDFLFDGEYLLVAEDRENLRTRTTPIAFLARGRFWVNNHVHIVRGNDEADTRFLMYALQAADIAGYLTGSTMPKLTQRNMNRIRLSLPPIDEQRAIAYALGSIDDKIMLNNAINATLRATAWAIYKRLFVEYAALDSIKRGAAGPLSCRAGELNAPSKAKTAAPHMPSGWQRTTIGDLADIVGGSTPSTQNSSFWEPPVHSWATPKDLSRLASPVLLETERLISDDGLSQVGSGLLPVGTVLMSSRAPIGYLAIAETPVAINQGFIAMKPKDDISNLFLLFWCTASHPTILSRANGSTFLEISKANFRTIEVAAPPIATMQAFDAAVRPLYDRIVANERQSRVLSTIRNVLLPRLMSGQLRLRPFESPPPPALT